MAADRRAVLHIGELQPGRRFVADGDLAETAVDGDRSIDRRGIAAGLHRRRIDDLAVEEHVAAAGRGGDVADINDIVLGIVGGGDVVGRLGRQRVELHAFGGVVGLVVRQRGIEAGAVVEAQRIGVAGGHRRVDVDDVGFDRDRAAERAGPTGDGRGCVGVAVRLQQETVGGVRCCR